MAAPTAPTAPARGALTVLCRALLEEVDDLADRLCDHLLAREDVYDVLGVPVADDLAPTCRASLERLLTQLAGDLPDEVDAAALTVDTGRRRARQGVPLEVVLRAYRRCGRLVWERMREVSRVRFGGLHDEALLVVADDVWRILDASSDRLVDAYRREETRLRARELGRRATVLEGLLAGHGHDPVVARDAARLLDLGEDVELLCVVAPTAGTDDDPLPHPTEVLAGIATAIWHARTAELVGIVVPSADARGAQPVVVAALRRCARGPVGVSPPVRGLARLDVAHRWARLAAHTLPPGSGAVAGLDERLPEALLAEAPDLVPRLRRAALGAVLDLPTPERDTLLATLRAVLDADGSPSRAATALYCHRNTVMYRLGRLEALTGHRLSDARHRLLLGLALAAPVPDDDPGSASPALPSRSPRPARHPVVAHDRAGAPHRAPPPTGDSVSGSDQIDALIAAHPDWRGHALAQARRIILDADPGITEEWKYMGAPVWELDGILVVGNIFAKKVKLGFMHGASLPDPEGLFNGELGGRQRRSYELAQGDEIHESALGDLVRAAVERNRSR